MKKLASVLTLAVLAATSASAQDYNARDFSAAGHQIGETVQVPARSIATGDDFVNGSEAPATVFEHSVNAPVRNPR